MANADTVDKKYQWLGAVHKRKKISVVRVKRYRKNSVNFKLVFFRNLKRS